jgi:DNA-binding transcriptional LysR family regulator
MIAVRATNDMRLVAVASPDYVGRRGRPQKPADLRAHNCIRLRLPDGAFIPWQFVAEGTTVEPDVEGSVIVNDPELVVSAAVEGIGVAYIFEDYVAPMLADGRLVRVLEDSALPPAKGFFLYYPSRRQNPAALQALIGFLRTNLRTNGSAVKTNGSPVKPGWHLHASPPPSESDDPGTPLLDRAISIPHPFVWRSGA